MGTPEELDWPKELSPSGHMRKETTWRSAPSVFANFASNEPSVVASVHERDVLEECQAPIFRGQHHTVLERPGRAGRRRSPESHEQNRGFPFSARITPWSRPAHCSSAQSCSGPPLRWRRGPSGLPRTGPGAQRPNHRAAPGRVWRRADQRGGQGHCGVSRDQSSRDIRKRGGGATSAASSRCRSHRLSSGCCCSRRFR